MTLNVLDNPQTNEPKKGGCLKLAGIGCISLLLLAILAGVTTYYTGKQMLESYFDEYTSATPLELPRIKASAATIDSLLQRLDAYTTEKGVEKRRPLRLTEEDINIIIQNHASFTEIKNLVYINITNGELCGKISIPLSKLGAFAEGRFLNGDATFTFSFEQHKLQLSITDMKVNSKSLPATFIEHFSKENLAKEFNSKKENQTFLKHIKRIQIEQNSIRITPDSEKETN